jgi:amino acid permease
MILKIEKGMFMMLLGVVVLIFILGFDKINLANLASLNLENIFLPFGVILFAFTGFSAIPDMSKVLGSERKLLKKAIIIGIITVFLVYVVFSLVIVGVSGENTSEESIVGLKSILGNKIVVAGAIFGILAMTTSFLTLGLALKDIFSTDFNINSTLAWVLTCFVPFILLIIGLSSFIEVLGIVGSLTGGFSSLLILMMHSRALKDGDQYPGYQVKLPRIILYFLYGIFSLGIIYQFYFILLA